MVEPGFTVHRPTDPAAPGERLPIIGGPTVVVSATT